MSLKELNLSWNHLRQDGAVALGAALSVSRYQLYMSSSCCCKHVRNGLIGTLVCQYCTSIATFRTASCFVRYIVFISVCMRFYVCSRLHTLGIVENTLGFREKYDFIDHILCIDKF